MDAEQFAKIQASFNSMGLGPKGSPMAGAQPAQSPWQQMTTPEQVAGEAVGQDTGQAQQQPPQAPNQPSAEMQGRIDQMAQQLLDKGTVKDPAEAVALARQYLGVKPQQ